MLIKVSLLIASICSEHGRRQTFSPGGGGKGGQGVGRVGADISNGRALKLMNAWTITEGEGQLGGGEGKARARGAAAPLHPASPVYGSEL